MRSLALLLLLLLPGSLDELGEQFILLLLSYSRICCLALFHVLIVLVDIADQVGLRSRA